jgi:hypothetical protein
MKINWSIGDEATANEMTTDLTVAALQRGQEGIAAHRALQEIEDRCEAWRLWAMECCVERLGAHRWTLVVDAGAAQLECSACPATGEDLIGDHADSIDLRVAVDVQVNAWRNWTDYGYEHDAELVVVPNEGRIEWDCPPPF